jgi:hypothetical protein
MTVGIRLLFLIGTAAALVAAAFAQDVAPASVQQKDTTLVAPDRDIPDTLMFDIDEYNEIQGRLASAGESDSQRNGASSIEKASLYLSTILYYGPDEWTIWVNGVPVGPDQDFQSFSVTSVGPNFVELLVPLSAQGMQPVRLSPNQTFIAASGTVVEGKWQ